MQLGSMPFGTYNSDTEFQTFADNIVKYTYRKLGGSILNVEINNIDVWTSLEEATLEYSAMINSYHAKSILADIMGSPTGSLETKEQKLARLSLAMANRKADSYASEAGVGGTRTLHSSSISIKKEQQLFNLQEMLEAAGTVTSRKQNYYKRNLSL